MKQATEKRLSQANIKFLEELFAQCSGIVQLALESILDKLAAPSPEVQRRLEKLALLEEYGVDNWSGYDEALKDWDGYVDEDEEEEEEND